MRHKREDYPTRVKLLHIAMEFYLLNGFTLTTNQMVARKAGCSTGQITNFFRSKENILCEIVKKVLPFHQETLAKNAPDGASAALRYSLEIAVELAMCENNEAVRDLYINAYTLPKPIELIREYSFRKSIDLFHDRLPDWSERDFYETESITMGIVFGGGLSERCNPRYPLDQKLGRVIDALLKMYEYSPDERQSVVREVLSRDIEKLAVDAEAQMRRKVAENISDRR